MSENRGTFELQSRMSELLYEKFLPVIEAQLDQISTSGNLIKIDRLELDLGSVKLDNNFEEDLVSKLEVVIRDSLSPIHLQLIHGNESGSFKDLQDDSNVTWSKLPEEFSAFLALTLFFEHGRLPWSIPEKVLSNKQTSRIGNLLTHVFKHDFHRLKGYLKDNSQLTRVQQRVYSHFNYEQVLTIFSSTFSSIVKLNFDELELLITELITLDDTGTTSTKIKNKSIWWTLFVILNQVENSEKIIRSFLPTLSELVRKEYFLSEISVLKLIKIALKSPEKIKILLTSVANLGIDIKAVAIQIQQDAKMKQTVMKKEIAVMSLSERWSSRVNIKEWEEILPHSTNDWYSQWEEYILEIADNKKQYQILENKKNQNVETPPLVVEQKKIAMIEEEGVYISNSGLVILANFLPFLFDHLNWLDDNREILDEAKPKALSMTQFLVSGGEEIDETLLPLNKLLLGYDMNQVVVNDYKLSDEERGHGEDLLENVIDKWSALGSVSADGLRSSFLNRDGIIYDKEEHYLLRVERKTLDILMDRMPWSTGVIKLNWMPKFLMVEW